MKLKKWENWTKFEVHIEKKLAWDPAGLFAEKVAIRSDSSDSHTAPEVGQKPKEGAVGGRFWDGVPGVHVAIHPDN